MQYINDALMITIFMYIFLNDEKNLENLFQITY